MEGKNKRREKGGPETGTHQASVHSSGSAYGEPEGHRSPYPQRACCDREGAEERVRSGSCHLGPWACFEWVAVGEYHKHIKKKKKITPESSEKNKYKIALKITLIIYYLHLQLKNKLNQE